jgi:hypothetical protein
MLAAFLRLHRVTVVALRGAIGEDRISRQTLDSLISGSVHARTGTVALVVQGLATLVPRKRLSERALRRLAATPAPTTPEAQLREIERAMGRL